MSILCLTHNKNNHILVKVNNNNTKNNSQQAIGADYISTIKIQTGSIYNPVIFPFWILPHLKLYFTYFKEC